MSQSKIMRSLGRNLGLEDDAILPGEGETGEVLNGDETVEGELLEVTEAAGEVEENTEVVEELEEAREGLSEVAESLEAIAADGGLDRKSAVMFHHAANAYLRRFGMEAIDIVPSLESFGGNSARMNATTVSLEGVGEWLKAAWEMIMKQLKKLWAYIKNWYLKVLDAAPRLKARAQAISKKASSASGTKGEKTVEVGALKALHIGGKAPTDLKTHAGHVVSSMKKMLADQSASKLEEAAEGAVKGLEEVSTDKGKVLDDIKSRFVAGYQVVAGTLKATVDQASTLSGKRYEGMEGFRTGELLGGKAVVAKMAKSDDATPANIGAKYRSVVVGMENYEEKPKEVENTGTFQTLELNQITDVCDQVVEICDAIIDYKKLWEKRDQGLAKIDKAAKKMAADAEKNKDLDGAEQRALTGVASGVAAFYRNNTKGAANLINYGLSTGKALLSVCERSLAQYK